MNLLTKKSTKSIPITTLASGELRAWIKKQDKKIQEWIKASGFTAAAGSTLLLPGTNGALSRVLAGIGADIGLYTFSALPASLPKNPAGYFIDRKMNGAQATKAALGWALGCYDFGHYRSSGKKEFATLVWPDGADRAYVTATAEAMFLVRDLVNTPANDMGPEELAQAARKVATTHKAECRIIVGDALLKQNYPAIHAVGKGSPRAPRLIDIRWGNPKNPKVTLVGKGVCFDTGGLDIKPSNAMDIMKKDMGGAAHVLGLAHMIMAARLPVRLRVLIPAVENSTDGNSFRPRDILQSRKGITIEIGDTDAEGRLVLCDALAEACTEKPSLIMDFATLTGAARVALGPDLPALFCNEDKTAEDLLDAAQMAEDPLWRLPLWQPYADMLKSKIADTNNIGGGGFGGAITAALFLEKFVDKGTPWVHVDTYAWMPSAKPGRPEGGEALGVRAAFEMIRQRFMKGKP
jgi:leucyl aminopeptidase